MVLILWLVLYVLSHPVITAFRSIIGLRYKVSNIRPVGPNHLYDILFPDFVVNCTIIFCDKGRNKCFRYVQPGHI